MLWAAGESTTPMEQLNNNHSFNLKQREMFSKLLVQAKDRVQAELESDYDVSQRVKEELLPKLVEEYGAAKLIERIRRLRKDLSDQETALSNLGFECSEDDDISIRHDAPKALHDTLDSAQRSAERERDQVLKKYDLAILKVWASEDAQDARKIVEGLL
jgi:hypothetical protein